MKLKLLLICFLIARGLALQAQDYKVIGMESLPTDMTAREHIKTDEKGKQCAVLRIATQNITPEQREGFHFESDWGSYVVERSIIDGEICIWVSPGLKTLKILHGKLGKWELHTANYGITVESLHTYKIVIQGTMFLNPDSKPEVTQQYLTFQITPVNATLEVNDKLWSVDAEGTATKFVEFGTYTYRVRAADYFTETGEVTVDDPNNTKIVVVNLKSNFSEVTLTVDADAEIWLNDEKKGVRTWTGPLGNGTYKIECKQAGHETTMISKTIDEKMNGKTITLLAPKPIYGSMNVESNPNLATLYIDGKEMGKTPKSINEILVGNHEIKLSKDGYINHSEAIVINKGERKQVKVTLNRDDSTPPAATKSQQPRPQQSLAQQNPTKIFFVMANAAYSIAPQTSFGLTVGSVKRFGWYVSFGTNFNFNNSSDFKCSGNGQIYNSSFGEYHFLNNQKTSRLSATAGMMFRISDPLFVYLGGGYGHRSLLWEFYDSNLNYNWAKNTDYSYQSFALDAGFMIHFSGFGLSVGVQTIGFNYIETKIGLGYTLKK